MLYSGGRARLQETAILPTAERQKSDQKSCPLADLIRFAALDLADHRSRVVKFHQMAKALLELIFRHQLTVQIQLAVKMPETVVQLLAFD